MAKPEKHKTQDDGNSEKELIDLLKLVLTDEFKEVHNALHAFRTALALKETKDQERHNKIMTALEDLQAAINESTTAQTDLTTAVNAAIVKIGTTPVPADEAALTAAAVAVRANAASDTALTSALNTAVGTPPVVVPVP